MTIDELIAAVKRRAEGGCECGPCREGRMLVGEIERQQTELADVRSRIRDFLVFVAKEQPCRRSHDD